MTLNVSGTSPNLSTRLSMEYLAHILRQWSFNIKSFATESSVMEIQPNSSEDVPSLEKRLDQALKSYPFSEYPGSFHAERGKAGNSLVISFITDDTNQRYQAAYKLTELAKGWLKQQGLNYSEELDYQGLPQLAITLASVEEAEAFAGRFPLFVLTKEDTVLKVK